MAGTVQGGSGTRKKDMGLPATEWTDSGDLRWMREVNERLQVYVDAENRRTRKRLSLFTRMFGEHGMISFPSQIMVRNICMS